VKTQRKNTALRGAAIGFGIFALLAAVCLFTPLRQPLLAVAGLETPALTYRLQAQRDTMDALQTRASVRHLAPAERAALERARMNARFSLFGLFDWIRELFPWLLAFGLALPVLGGLIGAQVGANNGAFRADGNLPLRAPHGTPDAVNPPSVPLDRPRPVPPPPPAAPPGTPVRQAYVHPAVAAATAPGKGGETPPLPSAAQRPLPGSPVILPPDIVAPAAPSAAPDEPPSQDWGFRHPPTPLETRPRPKMPPVRSPHALDEGVSDNPEDHLAG
jgi:hypothetical protein